MNQEKVTIVPTNKSILTREWGLVCFALTAVCLLWALTGFNDRESSVSAENVTAYTAQSKTKELEITFLDVGEGDAAFIRTPNGHTALIDAGAGRGKYTNYDAGLRVIVPFLREEGIRKIDTLIMSHPHSDHYGGMIPILNAVKVGEFLDPGLAHTSEGYKKLLQKIDSLKIPFKLMKAPNVLSWDPSILVQVLWPEAEGFVPDDPNNNSMVIRFVYGDIVYLFTGDIESIVEDVINEYGHQLRATVLKVPHHGSETSSTRQFLQYTSPRLAIMSLGMNNKFGHPNPQVLDRYEDMKIKVLRTDKNGTIRTYCNGNRVNVEPEIGTKFTIYPFPDQPLESE